MPVILSDPAGSGEAVIFNPPGGGLQLTLTSAPYRLLEHTYPAPATAAQWASSADTEGAELAAQRDENRELAFRVECLTKQALVDLQAAIGAFRTQSGGTIVRTPAGWTNSITFDVLLPGPLDATFDHVFELGGITGISFSLTCKPYGRGAQVTGPTTTGTAPILTLDVTGVPGDVEAETILVITDSAAQNRRYVQWGAGPDTTNAIIIDSDSLVTTGFAGVQGARAGAYDPDATGNSVITTTLIGATTAICGTGAQSHQGAFRVFARVYSAVADARIRLAWQNKDGPTKPNRWFAMPQTNQWWNADLGLVEIDETDLGSQLWTGRIDGLSATGGTFDIDFLMLVPVDYGYGVARAVVPRVAGVVVGWDAFSGMTAGAGLTGRVATLGGTWSSTGTATDFTAADGPDSGDETVTRAATQSVGTQTALLGTTIYTDTEVAMRAQYDFASSYPTTTVIARYVDANNYLRARLEVSTGDLYLEKVVAGVVTTLSGGHVDLHSNVWWRLRLVAYAGGQVYAWVLAAQGTPVLRIGARSNDLAAGGPLASGKVGFSDLGPSGVTMSRYYDDFAIVAPAAEDITLHDGETFRIAFPGRVERESGDGTKYGKPSSWEGHRIKLPPGDSRIAVRANRVDLELSPYDVATDSLDMAVFYTPRYLVIPEA